MGIIHFSRFKHYEHCLFYSLPPHGKKHRTGLDYGLLRTPVDFSYLKTTKDVETRSCEYFLYTSEQKYTNESVTIFTEHCTLRFAKHKTALDISVKIVRLFVCHVAVKSRLCSILSHSLGERWVFQCGREPSSSEVTSCHGHVNSEQASLTESPVHL